MLPRPNVIARISVLRSAKTASQQFALRARQGIKQTCSQSALGGFGALRAEGFRPGLRVLTFPTDNSEPQQSTAGKIVTLQACFDYIIT